MVKHWGIYLESNYSKDSLKGNWKEVNSQKRNLKGDTSLGDQFTGEGGSPQYDNLIQTCRVNLEQRKIKVHLFKINDICLIKN